MVYLVSMYSIQLYGVLSKYLQYHDVLDYPNPRFVLILDSFATGNYGNNT